ncbi:hypothetical protein B0J13DRAFT_277310 [Dactylonectria estremocensis]|uniref:Survival Motor Neuron Gemin2-binding domain-containing protein n=1 Tax=Dactylonectria estremocensis TaxID=1079267 RepID=A0A9P9F0Z9_9HYPO|nr:hypothetical protein B0J13DRAFT_277310 [Dactylonectria estremocensis]
MGGNKKELSQEEVWDDSALIDSWNEALQEYKKYHSIHAKGGSVRDLEPKNRPAVKTETESDQHEDTLDNAEIAGETRVAGKETADEKGATTLQYGPSHKGPEGGLGAFPVQAVLGSVQDENLKKLLMSWYYAGYYTGLFEGQQQAQSRES